MQTGTGRRVSVSGFALGVLLTALAFTSGILLFGNSPTVIKNYISVPKSSISIKLPAPKAPPVVTPPAAIQSPSVNSTFDICDMADLAYTDYGTPVFLNPENTPMADRNNNCSLSDSGYNYTVSVFVQRGASSDDYQSNMNYDNTTAEPGVASSGPAVPIKPLTPNMSAAYYTTGTYTDNSPFHDITMLVMGASGATYLVTVDVSEYSQSTPALNANNLASTVALLLP